MEVIHHYKILAYPLLVSIFWKQNCARNGLQFRKNSCVSCVKHSHINLRLWFKTEIVILNKWGSVIFGVSFTIVLQCSDPKYLWFSVQFPSTKFTLKVFNLWANSRKHLPKVFIQVLYIYLCKSVCAHFVLDMWGNELFCIYVHV